MKQSKIMSQIASVYIMLPFFVFSLTWIKLPIAILICIALSFCLKKVCEDSPILWLPEWNRSNIVKLIIICLIIAIWVLGSGIGKYSFQNDDHMWRNTIFNVLVEYDWPVLYKNASGDVNGMIYYIGFWLPPAILGKVFGIEVGYFAQFLWAGIGLFFVYYFICARQKKLLVWPLLVFVLFSGLDVVGVLLNHFTTYSNIKWHLEWWGLPYQYSSNTTQLFWVFNQSIPAWLCTILAYLQKNNRNLVFILACSMLTSTFPFVGLLLIVLFLCFDRKYDNEQAPCQGGQKVKQYITNLLKDTCTIQNVLGGGIIGIVSFLYLCGNTSAGHIEGMANNNFDFKVWVVFLFLEVGVYALLIYHYQKKNKLYYFNLLCLGFFPLIRVGAFSDFCMRASIPALFLLTLWVIEAMQESRKEKARLLYVGLLTVFLIGAVTSMGEICRTISETYTRYINHRTIYAEDVPVTEILDAGNFSGNIEHNFFFKYMGK